ncbi:hypothetical protein NC652_037960 [Populus alba x Populus x berolinensis]|nr:hypothetical protein NC652_037960 [Populus alba x Populus x berolinensis]
MSSSPAPSPPRVKTVFADFAGPSRGVRVSSNRRNRPMESNCSPHSSSAPSGDHSSGSSRPTLSSRAYLPSRIAPLPARTTSSPPQVKDKSLPGSHRSAPTETPIGISTSSPPTLVHLPDYKSSASCHLQDTNIGEPIPMWKFCLIGYVVWKFLGYAAMLHFIRKNWKHKSNFTMHDSGWLIFAFHSKLEMLDILSGGPYFIFG